MIKLLRARPKAISLRSIYSALYLGALLLAGAGAQAATTTTPVSLSLASASYGAVENIGVKLIPVNRTGGAVGAVSVVCKTVDNTATAGAHYTAVTQTLTWANGNTTPQNCHIPILNTTPFMGTRTFFVEIANPTGATLGAVTKSTISIYGDEQNSKVALSSATYSVKQNAGSLTITVARTGYAGGKASVGYATADSTAVAGKDYSSARGELSWNYGDSAAKTFVIPISNATPYVGTKTLALAIASPIGTAIGTASAVVTIAGDGVAVSSSPPKTTPPVTTPPPSAPTSFGTWVNVTPSSADLNDALGCGNYGTESIQVDPNHPSNLYTEFNCQGVWKSTDYGATWSGPINTGSNGAAVSDCAGGITIPPSSSAALPTIYESCIRGSGTGFWKSVDGGVNWTRYTVAPSGASRQDYYPPVVDPYNENHLLMAGHEMDYLVESVDGGHTWSNVSLANGMLENGGTGAIFFINTGTASTTSTTWLWMAQQSGGSYGTWRTTNAGAAWVQVDKNEHPHGSSQLYQPDTKGVVYMAGAYSAHGWGVLRSTDYGQTWSHVGGTSNETVVLGTPKNLYSMFGYPIGIGGINDPAFEIAAQPGTGSWASPGTPSALTQGAAQINVVNDGTHNILIGAMWNSGLWRYVEP
jgi:hypothetical protein